MRSEEHTELGATLEEAVHETARRPLPGSCPKRPSSSRGPGGRRETPPFGRPRDQGPALQSTPRRAPLGCKPSAFHHRPPGTLPSRGSRVPPGSSTRPGVATSADLDAFVTDPASAASTGPSVLNQLERPDWVRAFLACPKRPFAAPQQLLRP
jgi:hypothetical protein